MQHCPTACSSFPDLPNTFSSAPCSLSHTFRPVPLLRRLVTDARVQSRASPYGICGRQCDAGQVYLLDFGFPCRYHSTNHPRPLTHHGHYTIFTLHDTRATSLPSTYFLKVRYKVHRNSNPLLAKLNFTSGNSFCWPCSGNVSVVLPDDGPWGLKHVWLTVASIMNVCIGWFFVWHVVHRFDGRHHDVLYIKGYIKTLFYVYKATCFDLFKWPSPGLLADRVNICCVHVGIPMCLHCCFKNQAINL